MRLIALISGIAIAINAFVAPVFGQNDTDRVVITPENAHQLAEVNRLGLGTVFDVDWSPSGDVLAIGGGVGVWIINRDFKIQGLLNGWASSIAWSPDGERLLAQNDRRFTLWDTSQLSEIATWETQGPIPADFDWSPDGNLVAMVSGRNVQLRTVMDGTLIREWQAHSGSALTIAWSPDDKLIATGDSGGTIRIWNTTTAEEQYSLEFTNSVQALAWSPQSRSLAIGLSETSVTPGLAIILDVNLEVINHEGHAGSVSDIVWSPNGSYLAIANTQGTLQLWDVATGRVVSQGSTDVLQGFSPEHRSWVDWSPDSEYIAFGQPNTVHIWNATSNEFFRQLDGFTSPYGTIAWSSDMQYIAAHAETSLIIWEPEHSTAKRVFDDLVSASAQAMVWSPHQSVLFFEAFVVENSSPFTWMIWDAGTDTLSDYAGALTGLSQLVFAPDGTHFVAAMSTGEISIFDKESGQLIQELQEPNNDQIYNPWNPMAWSPDGKWLAKAFAERIVIWDVETGMRIDLGELDGRVIVDFAWLPDNNSLVITTGESRIDVLDVTGINIVMTMQTDGRAFDVALSPDGELLAVVTTKNVEVWTLGDGKSVHQLGDRMSINGVNWSPDGTLLATAAGDGTVRLWGISDDES